MPGAADCFSDVVERRVQIGSQRDEAQLGAVKPIQQDVAGTRMFLALAVDAFLEQHGTGEPRLGRGGGDQTCVVGLNETVDQERVATLRDGFAQVEFELADLAAAPAPNRCNRLA